MKIFVSGSYSINRLPEEVKGLIDKCAERGDVFLVGDCKGADTVLQGYLAQIGCKNVEVYHSGNIRNYLGGSLGWKTNNIDVPKGVTGREFHTYKDVAMTSDCDKAIALWDGKSKGTQNNIDRLKAQRKQCVVLKPVARKAEL